MFRYLRVTVLGCREFAARFRLVSAVEGGPQGWQAAAGEPPAQEAWSADLGWMLYDLDFSSPAAPQPQSFRAVVNKGVLDLAHAEVRQ